MLQELFFRLFSPGISTLISFVAVVTGYSNNRFIIESKLSNPVTSEVLLLIREGFIFKTDYYISVLINDNKKAFSLSFQVSVKYLNGNWMVNDSIVDYSTLQENAGKVKWIFNGVKFNENQKINVYVKAKLPQDSVFF